MKYNDRGEEIPDDTPVEVPLRFRSSPDEVDRIRNAVISVLSQDAASREMETFEEADDFNVSDDDDNLSSPHELTQMQEDADFSSFAHDVVDKTLVSDNNDHRSNPDDDFQLEAEDERESRVKRNGDRDRGEIDRASRSSDRSENQQRGRRRDDKDYASAPRSRRRYSSKVRPRER